MSTISDPRTTLGQTHTEDENKDLFLVTPPRKGTQQAQSETPFTPKSKGKSTPLHKRFLEEVTMSPGTPSTPPRTPSRSPRREQTPAKQTLEVGKNGFYFSMEIPKKKITPRKMGRMTPDVKAEGRRTPSPEKERRGELRGAGRVKDILRKNLFGTPARKTTKLAPDGKEQRWMEEDGEVKTEVPKDEGDQADLGCGPGTSDSSGRESAQGGGLQEAATKHTVKPSIDLESPSTARPSAPLETGMPPLTMQKSNMTPTHQQTPILLPPVPALITTTLTPSAPALQKSGAAASTPSNIGHLMAGLSNKGSKIQSHPPMGGPESMPTPLRKMSERLGLRSPHVVRRGTTKEIGPGIGEVTNKKDGLRERISVLDLHGTAIADNISATNAVVHVEDAPTALALAPALPEGGRSSRREDLHSQLLGSPLIIPSTTINHSRPSTATTSKYASPLTPSRPGPPSRSQSSGTPTHLRSSMQEDMHRMQESLKRSLGADAFEKRASRPSTPISPTVIATSIVVPRTDDSNGRKKTARPISMIGPARSKEESSTQAVSRRPLNTAARKPRPKSMIVGSAKVLETVASQTDSPRERAKLRSAATTASTTHPGPLGSRPTSRPGTAASTLRGAASAIAAKPTVKSQPVVRTTKSAALRAAAHAKGATSSTPTTTTEPGKQRVASAEAIAHRIGEWKKEEHADIVPKIPVRTKSIKAPSKTPSKAVSGRKVKTPEPKDIKKDSGTEESFTPPGNPTRLPSPTKSPSKTRFVPATPAPKPAPRMGPPPSNAAKPHLQPAKTPVNRKISWADPNASRTPSKEIQSSLDEAIDRKIAEDRRRWEGVLGEWEN